jgi:hypothetical protein
MPPWALLLVILFVWCLAVVSAGGEKAVDEARRGIPEEKRGGVSWFPVVPIIPLILWGVAIGIDALAEPWGTWIIGSLHGLFALVLLVSIGRALWRLRELRS